MLVKALIILKLSKTLPFFIGTFKSALTSNLLDLLIANIKFLSYLYEVLLHHFFEISTTLLALQP
jgi:hypothetical protein